MALGHSMKRFHSIHVILSIFFIAKTKTTEESYNHFIQATVKLVVFPIHSPILSSNINYEGHCNSHEISVVSDCSVADMNLINQTMD